MSKQYQVYGGSSYSADFTDAIPGVDTFDNLADALEEFRYRQDFGRTRQGLACPVWDSEGSGGVIETDSRGDAVDLHRPERTEEMSR